MSTSTRCLHVVHSLHLRDVLLTAVAVPPALHVKIKQLVMMLTGQKSFRSVPLTGCSLGSSGRCGAGRWRW